jgi:hypothetical protein
MRAPDSHGSFWRQQPTDEYRTILSQAIIEEITETSFTSASLDEVQYRWLLVLHLEQIKVYLLLVKQIHGYVWDHSHRRSR